MKAHIANSEIEKIVKAQLEKARYDGLAIGAKSISKVILNKATDESKSTEDRLAEIVRFCKVGLGDKGEATEVKE